MTTTNMTPERLAEIKDRCNAVTSELFINMGFIVHARQDIPDLLAEVHRLKGELAKAEKERDEAFHQNSTRMLESVHEVLNGMVSGVTGIDSKTHFSMGIQCPYCGSRFESIEEAEKHDAICVGHPAVKRSLKAELCMDILADKLEDVTSDTADSWLQWAAQQEEKE